MLSARDVPSPTVIRSIVREVRSSARALSRFSVRPPVRFRVDVPCMSIRAVLKLERFSVALFSVAEVVPESVSTWPVEIMGAPEALPRITVELLMAAFPVRLTVRSLGAEALPRFWMVPVWSVMALARAWLLALSVPPCTRTEPWPSAVAELVWSVPCTMVVPPVYVLLPEKTTTELFLFTFTLIWWEASLSEMTEEMVKLLLPLEPLVTSSSPSPVIVPPRLVAFP